MIPKDVCLRCGGTVRFWRRERIQLGKQGWLLGDLPHLLAGAITLNIFLCEDCRRCEFYIAEEDEEETHSDADTGIAQITCPVCGHRYDIDYPKCPCCRTETRF
ncbi:MAG: hypothetical protein E7618_02250 [Ruminococcaceae bacterium]|nr:hypothetical protein [Oscillospiraceae bacterium]